MSVKTKIFNLWQSTEESSQKFENEELTKSPPTADGRAKDPDAYGGHIYLNIACLNHDENRYESQELKLANVPNYI